MLDVLTYMLVSLTLTRVTICERFWIMKNAEKTKPSGLKKSSYHHGDLRSGLLSATRKLVEEKGPDGFSVSDACRLAGVSTAAPYKHFKDKSEMIAAMIMQRMQVHGQNMAAALEGITPGTVERINVLGREYVNFALREPGVFRLKFGGFTDHYEDPGLEQVGEATFDLVLREVAACLGQEEITDEVRERGFILWSFVHGLSFLLADEKLKCMGGDLDLDHMLDVVGERMLAD